MYRHNGRTYHSVASPGRHPFHGAQTPHASLLAEMQRLASDRLEFLITFLKEWPARKGQLAPEAYEILRAEAGLHLVWIFQSEASHTLTFSDICALSHHPELSDVEALLQHLRQLIDPTTHTELRRPLDPWAAHQAEQNWLEGRSGVDARRQTKGILNKRAATVLE